MSRTKWSFSWNFGSSRRDKYGPGSAPVPSFDPFTYFGSRLVDAAWIPYEGPGTVPAGLAAEKQTGADAYGDNLSVISDYSGNNDHNNVVSSGAVLTAGVGGGPAYADSTISGIASYSRTSPPQLNDDLSIVQVWGRLDLTQGGFLYQHGSFSPLVQLSTSNPYNVTFYHQLGNVVVPIADTDFHVTMVHADKENTKTDIRVDGTVYNVSNSIHDYGTLTTMREFSGSTGSSRVRAKQVGWFKIRNLTTSEAEQLEAWIASQAGITLTGP